MSLSELLPKLKSLTRADKLRLIQIMVADLAQEEGVPLIEVGVTYPVWSPYHAFDAAEAMLSALDEEKVRE
jgi:hypothetical protein